MENPQFPCQESEITHTDTHTHSQPALRADNSGEIGGKKKTDSKLCFVSSGRSCKIRTIPIAFKGRNHIKRQKKKSALLNDGNRNFTWSRSFSTRFSITSLLGEYFDPRNLSVFFSSTEMACVIRSKIMYVVRRRGGGRRAQQVGTNPSYVIIL